MRRKSSTFTLVLVLLLFAACASKDAAKRITAFSDAVNVTMQNTSTAFDIVERKYLEVQTVRTVVNYDRDGFDRKKIHRFLEPDELKPRLDVIEGLKRYAETLAAIMSDDQLNEFDKQTKALGESLKSLNTDLVSTKLLSKSPTDASQIAIFTTAINALGRWFIEYRRQKAVRETVLEMDPHVSKICDLLMLDLGSSPRDESAKANGLRGQLWNEYTQAQNEQKKFIEDNKLALARDPTLKRAEIKQLVSSVSEQEQADATLKSMQGTVGKLKETHGKLVDAFGDNRIEIDHLLAGLVTEGKRVKDFYDKLVK